jgi:hypothetical protein
MNPLALEKIISGGQTGADRAALDAALEAGFPCGGFCPKGRLAEDGVIDGRYPLEEIDGGYAQRTLLNVQAADATVVFYSEELTGGTLQTVNDCQLEMKPCLEIDIARLDDHAAMRTLEDFLRGREVRVLNVAGPRASGSPAIYSRVRSVMRGLMALQPGKAEEAKQA